jgi:sigma-E factor negative regulatory protein RseA
MSINDPIENRRRALSALMDGDGQAAEEGCRAWRDDAQSRQDWHAYHLIGDLLRSDEHRCDAAHDALFVARLREKLVREPARLAPRSVAMTAGRRRAGWKVPAAVAAGFMAVAGALVATRMATPEGGSDPNARSASVVGGSSVQIATLRPAAAASDAGLDNANMIRSTELDRYLAAHRQYANASTLAAPGGVVRSVAVAAPGR